MKSRWGIDHVKPLRGVMLHVAYRPQFSQASLGPGKVGREQGWAARGSGAKSVRMTDRESTTGSQLGGATGHAMYRFG